MNNMKPIAIPDIISSRASLLELYRLLLSNPTDEELNNALENSSNIHGSEISKLVYSYLELKGKRRGQSIGSRE